MSKVDEARKPNKTITYHIKGKWKDGTLFGVDGKWWEGDVSALVRRCEATPHEEWEGNVKTETYKRVAKLDVVRVIRETIKTFRAEIEDGK